MDRLCLRVLGGATLLAILLASHASAQLAWNQKMDRYSAILPLTLEDDVYRVRAKPPEGVTPSDINCDIGITGTVLTDQRGTSEGDPGQKVLSGLQGHDRIDVQFSDRVFTGYHTLAGDRIIHKYDLDCGINIKYQNMKKVAQVEIRVGYVLPSGDIEGLTWAKLSRKLRQFDQNLDKCANCKRDINSLQNERSRLANSNPENNVQQMRIQARMTGIATQIRRLDNFANREDEFRRDMAAFKSIEEYLKTKVTGCQVYVHFHHDGKTLPVDIDDLKRSHVRPLQVFEETKDPIKNPDAANSRPAAGG